VEEEGCEDRRQDPYHGNCQNLSKRALNALTVQASKTELGKLFQIFTMHAKK